MEYPQTQDDLFLLLQGNWGSPDGHVSFEILGNSFRNIKGVKDRDGIPVKDTWFGTSYNGIKWSFRNWIIIGSGDGYFDQLSDENFVLSYTDYDGTKKKTRYNRVFV